MIKKNIEISLGDLAQGAGSGATISGRLPQSLAVISNQAFSLINFRGALIQDLVAKDVRVYALAPDFTDEFREKVRNLGAEPIDYSLQRAGLNPLRDSIDSVRLALLLRRLRPEATLAYFIKPVIFGTMAAWMAGVPARFAMIEGLGYVFMDDDSARTPKRVLLRALAARLYRLALSRAKRVILLNRDDVADLCSAGILARSKAVLIPGIGVSLKDFPHVPVTSDPVTFVLVARLLREKGVYDFVEAARLVKARCPGARFVLVGGVDANPGSVSEQELRVWEREGVVAWTGQIADVRSQLINASVFVLPSYYREGVPRSTQEAMAIGRPVITTNSPGCRDTVICGENGFLVPVRNPVALASAMVKFIEQPSLIESMGRASRRIAEERFDVTVINRRMLAALSTDA